MGFSSNLSRVFRSKKLFQNRENWQTREHKYTGSIRLNRPVVRQVNLEGFKRSVEAVLILSYEPKQLTRIRESEALIRNHDVEHEGFFGGTWNFILILARISVIGSIVAGLAIVYFITRLTHRHLFPTVLRKSVEFLGPIFIKLGQWASTRKDLFPQDICHTLSELQRTVSSHSWIYTKHLLKATYGPNWRKIFVRFEDQLPLGSGCCAQVYKAWVDPNVPVEVTQRPRISTFVQSKLESPNRSTLRHRVFTILLHMGEVVEYLKLGSLVSCIDRMLNSNGESWQDDTRNRKLQPVAIKVLHPGIKKQLRRDLLIMKGISKCVTYLVPGLQWLSLTDCIDEFAQIMENQVDMNLEAANLMKFSRNFSEKKNVIFPCPYLNFTQREILVESFHEGSPISDYLEYDDAKLQGKLAKIGITAVLKMVFKDNFIHCDLHPGNILVETNCESAGRLASFLWRFINPNYIPSNPRLIILDCGLVATLNDRCQRNLRDVFRSVLMGDGELAAEYILEHSSHISPDPDGFKNTMRDIVNSHVRRKINVGTVVTELFSAMIRHRVKQDGSFSSVILSMVVIEGLGRSLDPNIDIFAELLPFIFTSSLYDD